MAIYKDSCVYSVLPPHFKHITKTDRYKSLTDVSLFFHCNCRVYPEITLKMLRGELSALLGTERSINKYSFLKCVGQSLALVSAAGS